MILDSLRVTGVTSLKGAVVDFADLPEGVIAIIAPNGAGKSTLLSCAGPAALFREMPQRSPSPLANWCGSKGATLRLAFRLAGDRYNVDLLIGKTPTATLYRDGKPLNDGKLKSYDEVIVKLFGRPDAFYASVFAAQGGGGRFGALSVSDRRALFRFYLGLERMEKIAAAAKARISTLDLTRLDKLTRECNALEATGKPEAVGRLVEAGIEVNDAAFARNAAHDALIEMNRLSGLIAVKAAYDKAIADVLAAEERLALLGEGLVVGDLGAPDVDGARRNLERTQEHHERLTELNRDVALAERSYADAKRVLDEAEKQSRIIDEVPCRGAPKYAGCQFLVEGCSAKRALPDLKDAKKTLGEVQRDLSADRDELAMGAPDLKSDRAAYDEAVRLSREWETAKANAKLRATNIATAHERVSDARGRAMDARKALTTATGGKKLPTLPSASDLELAGREAAFRQANLDRSERERAAAEAAMAAVEGRIDILKDEIEGCCEIAEDEAALQALMRAFGPAGIQALEFDAAGPRVAALANDLLASCYGPRFAIEIKTLRELKSGKGEMAEDFSIQVHDSERGRSGDINSLSGGEQVIVDEALRSALSIFAASERLTFSCKTMYRDETPAALYGENIGRYATMLHRTRELGGFHHVLVVGGQEIADAATAVLRVTSAGQVERVR